MTDTTETDTTVETTVETPDVTAEVATEVTPEVTEEVTRREPVILDRPIQTVGRRKEAVVRVRLVPGTGQFNLDGRSLENYFPNKVHQQLIKAPLVTVDRVDAFDIFAYSVGSSKIRCASWTMWLVSVPTSFSVPASIPSGRSVVSRRTNTGMPKAGASSWIPPESVRMSVACFINCTSGR